MFKLCFFTCKFVIPAGTRGNKILYKETQFLLFVTTDAVDFITFLDDLSWESILLCLANIKFYPFFLEPVVWSIYWTNTDLALFLSCLIVRPHSEQVRFTAFGLVSKDSGILQENMAGSILRYCGLIYIPAVWRWPPLGCATRPMQLQCFAMWSLYWIE